MSLYETKLNITSDRLKSTTPCEQRRPSTTSNKKQPSRLSFAIPKDSNLASKYAQQEIVTILVGTEKTVFRLPKDFLRSKVPYFEASLKDCWNGRSNEIVFSDVDKAVFECFVDYLFMGKVPTYFVDGYSKSSRVRDIIALYSFADKLMYPKMKNDLADTEVGLLKNGSWHVRGVALVYAAGLASTPFYRLALASCVTYYLARNPKWDDMESQIDEGLRYPEVIKDLFRSIFEHGRGELKNPEESDACLFHDHTDGSSCT